MLLSERLNNVVQRFEELMSLTGKNEKQEYIAQYKDDKDFLTFIKYLLDPFLVYGIKNIETVYSTKLSTTFEEVEELLVLLIKSNINQSLRNKVNTLLSKCPANVGLIIKGIITKDLPIGIDTGINKALGYQLIPAFDVMLAAPLKEDTELNFPVIAGLKYDGVRCLAEVKQGVVTLYTRQGRTLNFPLIESEVLKLAGIDDIVFDGELITESRTDVSGICNSNLKKGYTPGTDEGLKYVIFDAIDAETFAKQGKTRPLSARMKNLELRFLQFNSKRVIIAEAFSIKSLDELIKLNNAYILKGEEGTIVKDPTAPYYYRRNKAWLKMKAINSATLKVTGVEYGKGKREGKVGALVCETSDGKLVVKVGSGLSDELVDLFTDKPPIGKLVEVIFNVLIKGKDSKVYSLFLPRYKEIRIDKTEADTLEHVMREHVGKAEV